MVGTSGSPVTFSSAMRLRTICGKVKDFSRTSVAPTFSAISAW